MKIVYVVNSISRAGGGVSEVVRLTVEALRGRRDVEIEIVTLADPSTKADLPLFEGTTVHVARPLPPARLGASLGLITALMRAKPDLVHVHGIWQFHTLAVLIWAGLTGKPYVISPHGMLDPWIQARSAHTKRWISRLFHDRFLRSASAFQALTGREVIDIQAVVPNANCHVVPNYVQVPPEFDEPPSWQHAEQQGREIYLFFGRIHEKKGCVELAEAWDAACQRDADFKARSALVFCGWNDGVMDFTDRLDAIANRHGNVVFGGAQYGVARGRTLAAADFVVLPSKSEGLPMVVLEAWAHGTPVLMTSACNLPTGFSAGAAREIHTDVAHLVDDLLAAGKLDAATRAAMSTAARNLVRTTFSAERVASELLSLYLEVGNAVCR